MARTQENIYQLMTTSYTSIVQTMFGRVINPAIFLPENWSMYNLEGLLFWVCAGAIAIFEQIFDNYTTGIEAIIAVARPQTNLWFQDKVINEFQYSATVPQVLSFNTTTKILAYPTVNAALRIVTQAAIVPTQFGTTTIKVAKGGINPVPLTSGTGSELEGLNSYLSQLSVPGINIEATSNRADKLFMQATINYNGQYSAIISPTVIAAINAYLRSIPTTGIVAPNSPVGLMKLTDLILFIRAVPGVIDIDLENVNARADGTTFPPAANNMVNNNVWITNEWQSGQQGAGWIVPETTNLYTFTDLRIPADPIKPLNLNFVAQ